jgi:hypothetical protein
VHTFAKYLCCVVASYGTNTLGAKNLLHGFDYVAAECLLCCRAVPSGRVYLLR